MAYDTILRCEREAQGILLLPEGLFYRAYEQSAYQLFRRFGLKPSKRYIKKAGTEVVSVGFPQASIGKFFPACEGRMGQAIEIAVEGRKDDGGFAQWKRQLPLREAAKGAKGATVPAQRGQDIVSRIRAFPIERRTPMECMLFLAQVKRELQEGGSEDATEVR